MKPLGGIALSLVVAVGLSACGSSESGASSQPETSEQAAGSSTTVAAPPKESYSGLGSKAAVFSASNEGKPSPNPPPGNTGGQRLPPHPARGPPRRRVWRD